MKEIIAAKIGTLITTNPKQIADAIYHNAKVEFIDRTRINFMVACDMGYNWERLSQSKTLFCIDDDGNPIAPIR